MYSYEIQRLLELRNYLISNQEFLEIFFTSPQITRVKYNAFTDEHETWTSDNYYFKYKVYRKE